MKGIYKCSKVGCEGQVEVISVNNQVFKRPKCPTCGASMHLKETKE